MIRTLPAVALAAILSCPAAAQADPHDETAAAGAPPARTATLTNPAVATPLADAARRQTAALALAPQYDAPIRRPQRRSVTRKILGGIAGGFGGFFLGGYLGAKIEGDDCNCDDPGFKGAIIGAPIGAAAGAIVGALVL
jgi:hypothetical protein